MRDDIAILIPAHNEEKNIGSLVSKLKPVYKNVVVVDDGSKDATAKIASEAGAEVISHPECRGKGEALKSGFRYVVEKNIPAVITLDGDGQHPVEDIKGFLDSYRKNGRTGIWVGRRDMSDKDMPLIRKMTNVSMSLLISAFARQWIPDTQCGFRLIKKEVISSVRLETSHFETESELLIKSSWKGFRIKPVKISTVYEDEKSKIKPLADTARFFMMTFFICCPWLLKLKKRRGKK